VLIFYITSSKANFSIPYWIMVDALFLLGWPVM